MGLFCLKCSYFTKEIQARAKLKGPGTINSIFQFCISVYASVPNFKTNPVKAFIV